MFRNWERGILPVGMARLDGFLDEKNIADFKKQFYKQYPDFIDKKWFYSLRHLGIRSKNAYYDLG